jgi:hypothetical protein
VFLIVTNVLEFFCIDADKASNQPDPLEIDYLETLMDTELGISDLESMVLQMGIDINSYIEPLCDFTKDVICPDIFELLSIGWLTKWRWFTDNTFCVINDNVLPLFGMDIAIDESYREPWSNYKTSISPFKWFN